MTQAVSLPKPQLDARLFGARRLSALTDDALFESTGVRIAFTGRDGGVSEGSFASLNLGGHVGDDADAVAQNRRILLDALGASDAQLIMANQVHGCNIVEVPRAGAGRAFDPIVLEDARKQALEGADALAVEASQVAALLCFADCTPVIIVSPSGRFAVAHAGWRGAVAGIAGKTVRVLARMDAEDLMHAGERRDARGQGFSPSCESDPEFDQAMREAAASFNAYIGPHIHVECFETGDAVREQFVDAFGDSVAPDQSHVDLSRAVSLDLERAGVSPLRIVDAGICTKCSSDEYFSYRASGGVCGRQGALAVLQKG